MAQQLKRNKGKKRKCKIKFKQTARLVEKNDSTSVASRNTLKKAPVKNVLPTNGITFKVKIRKK